MVSKPVWQKVTCSNHNFPKGLYCVHTRFQGALVWGDVLEYIRYYEFLIYLVELVLWQKSPNAIKWTALFPVIIFLCLTCAGTLQLPENTMVVIISFIIKMHGIPITVFMMKTILVKKEATIHHYHQTSSFKDFSVLSYLSFITHFAF